MEQFKAPRVFGKHIKGLYKTYLLKTDFTQIGISPCTIDGMDDFMHNDLLAQCQRWQTRLSKCTSEDELYLAHGFDFRTGQAVQLPVRAQQACTTQELLENHFEKDPKSNN